jgi:hypothetical protein
MDHINDTEVKELLNQRRLKLDAEEAERKKVREQLDSIDVAQKIKEREDLLLKVKEIEKLLCSLLAVPVEKLFGKSIMEDGSSITSSSKKTETSEGAKRRKSLSESEKIEKIGDLLKGKQEGLSAVEIARQINDTYNTVAEHLSRRTDLYSKTGSKVTTRYHLISNGNMNKAV